jgi:glycine cleavage system T protein (aminomethyltransferase)
MPVGTPFHPRTAALCESLSYRDWAGYYAVSSYETHHEHEYNAIRNAAGLIDVSPLYKYGIRGADARRLIDRVITRDAHRIKVGQVAYTSWCDGAGKILDDGTVQRLGETHYRWTAAEPSLRWIRQNAAGLDVSVSDESESTAAVALQGPTSRAVLRDCAELDVDALRYFRVAAGRIAGIPVEISRTGYTGDLGYEIWVAAERALELWDALIVAGRPHGARPAGLIALDVTRIEAGLMLLDVDYVGARTALIPSQLYTPLELGLGRLVHLDKGPFVGQAALRAEAKRGPARSLVGLEVDWEEFEALCEMAGLPPQMPGIPSRAPVPVYVDGRQVGKATSTAWSPTLKRLIALATVTSDAAEIGTSLRMEVTVDARRERVTARVRPLPFFDPPRKRA